MKKYNVIYADPPWGYSSKAGRGMKSHAGAKYQTMPIADIKAMPVRGITEKDSVLFIWVTVPLLPQGLEVMEAWGFKYKTMLTWKKSANGMGFWFRGQTEHLLLGVRGNVRAFRYQRSNFYQSRAGKHSEKPDYFRNLIGAATAKIVDRRCLELFARSRDGMFKNNHLEGWDVYGNEVDNSITL